MSEKSSEIKAKRRKGESDFSEGGIFIEYSLNFSKVSDKMRKKNVQNKGDIAVILLWSLRLFVKSYLLNLFLA